MNTPTSHVKNGRPLTATEKWAYMIASQVVKHLVPNGYRKSGNIEVSAIRHLTSHMVNGAARTVIEIFKQQQAQLEVELERALKIITTREAELMKEVRWWRPYSKRFLILHAERKGLTDALYIVRNIHPPETTEQLAAYRETGMSVSSRKDPDQSSQPEANPL